MAAAPPLLQLSDIAPHLRRHAAAGGRRARRGAGRAGRAWSGATARASRRCCRIAAGLIEPDRGERFMQPGASVRYLPQEPDLAGYATTLAYVEAGLGPTDDPHQARYLLQQLGLGGEEDPASLSGGELRRAALAHVLAPAPDILLLDEPTNHLDLPAIEWLEARLAEQRGALVLISHDRRFLREPVAGDRLARPRQDAAHRHRLSRLRGLARRAAGRGGGGPAQARPQDRARGALGPLRRHGPAQAQHAPHGRAAGPARGPPQPIAAPPAPPPWRRATRSSRASWWSRPRASPRPSAAGRSSPISPIASCAATASASSGRTAAARPRWSACSPARSAPDSGAGPPRRQPGDGDARPGAREPRSQLDPERGADRRPRRHGDGRRPEEARHRLHEGLPVRAAAGAHAAQRAVGRRARPPDAGPRAGQALQPAGARRADQRSRPRDARRAGGDARRATPAPSS